LRFVHKAVLLNKSFTSNLISSFHHIQTQVKKQHTDSQIKILSYIDDVTVIVVGNSTNENSIVLEKVTKSLFSWVKDNAVVFDDSKTELIHFNKDKETAISTVTLSNNTIIKSSGVVQWLEVWFD